MSLSDRVTWAALNHSVRGYRYEWKNPNDWLHVSLSQPPIRVLNKHDTDDELAWDVECPNCGSKVNFGKQIFMISGRLYCSTKGCREKLLKEAKYGKHN